jgi:hypothetical protein
LFEILLPWSAPYEDPIPLPNGRQLVTLREAADYITKLPKSEQNQPEWQTAIHCQIGAAEGRDFLMHAWTGAMRGLDRGHVREFTDTGKTHLGPEETHDGRMRAFASPRSVVHDCGIYQPGSISMPRILPGIAAAFILFASFAATPSAAADAWGCSYEKCLTVCQKAGGQHCTAYCTKALRDKQTSKVCK